MTDNNEEVVERRIDGFCQPQIPGVSTRYGLAIMAFFGLWVCHNNHNHNAIAAMELEDSATKWEYIYVPFSWGKQIGLLLGLILPLKISAHKIFGFGTFAKCILNMSLPLAMKYEPVAVLIIRCLQGFAEGLALVAVIGLWKYWAPPLERSRLVTIAFTGNFVGRLFVISVTPITIELFPSMDSFYYLNALVGTIWFAFWLWMTFDAPRLHPSITTTERQYIESSIGESAQLQMPSFPWKEFFTSAPVYALLAARLGTTGLYIFHDIPRKLDDQGYHMSYMEYSLLMSAILTPWSGVLADYLRQPGRMTTTVVRKIFIAMPLGTEAICALSLIWLIDFSYEITSVLVIVIGIMNNLASIGCTVAILDIAPRYATVIMALALSLDGIMIRVASVVLFIIWDWKSMVIATIITLLASAGIYVIFGSGNLQPWAEPKPRTPQDAEANEQTNFFHTNN